LISTKTLIAINVAVDYAHKNDDKLKDFRILLPQKEGEKMDYFSPAI
jgi:hypothetical protein